MMGLKSLNFDVIVGGACNGIKLFAMILFYFSLYILILMINIFLASIMIIGGKITGHHDW